MASWCNERSSELIGEIPDKASAGECRTESLHIGKDTDDDAAEGRTHKLLPARPGARRAQRNLIQSHQEEALLLQAKSTPKSHPLADDHVDDHHDR
jgi:hypothetical protein